jgi:hypothetical protein
MSINGDEAGGNTYVLGLLEFLFCTSYAVLQCLDFQPLVVDCVADFKQHAAVVFVLVFPFVSPLADRPPDPVDMAFHGPAEIQVQDLARVIARVCVGEEAIAVDAGAVL